MINKIKIQNFKNIRDQAIDLERLTVIVGANASGKTSVLEALHLAVRAATGDPKKVFGYERHCDWLYTRGGTGDTLACTTDTGTIEVTATPATDALPQNGSPSLRSTIRGFGSAKPPKWYRSKPRATP